ncbi:hypothetical protein K1719_018546 [Acacia pycnantha]|nr:hypothetical protein K1719_018546 [Acacia pycnantha]
MRTRIITISATQDREITVGMPKKSGWSCSMIEQRNDVQDHVNRQRESISVRLLMQESKSTPSQESNLDLSSSMCFSSSSHPNYWIAK